MQLKSFVFCHFTYTIPTKMLTLVTILIIPELHL